MSNETLQSYLVAASAALTAISGSTTLASNGFNGSTEVTSLTSANHAAYPMGDLYFQGSFSTSISSASAILNVYRRDKNLDGSNHAPQPQSAAPAYSNIGVGQFQVPAFSAGSISCILACPDVPLGDVFELYLENKTNATLLTGYVLKVRPKTLAPAP